MNYFEVVVSVRQENTDSKGNVKIKKVKIAFYFKNLCRFENTKSFYV